MKRNWQLLIVIVGTIGILSYLVSDAFFSELTNPLGALRLFKYFTMLTNLLAVIYFWLLYSLRLHYKHPWLDRYIGGFVMYLLVTFVIYALLLEGSYEQNTLDIIGNVSLHYLNPALVVAYYIYFRKNYTFLNRDMLYWFIYPAAYILFMIVHGLITNDYLYPFFQVSEVGVQGLLSMIVILVGVNLLLSFVLVKIVSRK